MVFGDLKKSISLLIFICGVSELTYSQSVQDELKKDLWKSIVPSNKKSDLPMQPTSPDLLEAVPQQEKTANEVLYYYYKSKYKFLSDDLYMSLDYKKTHDISALNATIKGNEFKDIKPSGFVVDISGGGRKHLSEKTKRILREVYGQEPDE